MIMVYPHNADWDDIAELTGDHSWRARNMRRYFERLENCRHRWPYRLLYRLTGWNPTKHGFSGWLSVEKAIPPAVLTDHDLVKIVKKAAWACFWELADWWGRIKWVVQSQGDPNDWRLVKKNAIGVHYAPIHTHKHARNGTREFVLDVARRHPDRLKIELDALATEVLFDESNRAIGVAYLKGAKLYRAAYEPSAEPGSPRTAHCTREVILSGGAFNTPQLLMLSGHRPERAARTPRHQGARESARRRQKSAGPLRSRRRQPAQSGLDHPEGRHLHARRSAVQAMGALAQGRLHHQWRGARDHQALAGRTPAARPVHLRADRKIQRLFPRLLEADRRPQELSDLVHSQGPYQKSRRHRQAALEGPARPATRSISIISRKAPTPNGDDLASGGGRHQVRAHASPSAVDAGIIVEERNCPATKRKSDAELGQFVQDNAWGHHASCTCPIGPASDPMAVLDSNFRVYGTSNLRVVDASVFPKIPGFFIVLHAST